MNKKEKRAKQTAVKKHLKCWVDGCRNKVIARVSMDNIPVGIFVCKKHKSMFIEKLASDQRKYEELSHAKIWW